MRSGCSSMPTGRGVFDQPPKLTNVVPAQAGTHGPVALPLRLKQPYRTLSMDPRLRGDDVFSPIWPGMACAECPVLEYSAIF
jgi:hypothetical protein